MPDQAPDTPGTARQRKVRSGVALAILVVAASSARAAGDPPILHPGETVHLELPPGDPETTAVTLRLVAARDGPLTVGVSALHFDTSLRVFDADAAAGARPLAKDEDGGVGSNSRATFEAVAGHGYHVIVRAFEEDWGGPFEVVAEGGRPSAPNVEEERERDLKYWDEVSAEAARSGSEVLAGRALAGRGALYLDADDAVAARRLLEAAQETFAGQLGAEHPRTATCMARTAEALQSMGEYTAARPLYERALAIRERVFGPTHPRTSASLNDLAVLLWQAGDPVAARPLYERALAIDEQVYGPDHPQTATTLNNLALLLRSSGQQAAARPLLERAAKIYERARGPEHPETANALNGLAMLLQDAGDYGAARPLFERALAAREKALGPEHPLTAASLGNLATLLRSTGEYAAARPLYERALAIREKALGPEHPGTAAVLHNLASLLRAQGDYAAARPLFERALGIREKALGPEHPETAMSLGGLASLLQTLSEYSAARPLYERVLAIRERVLGPRHRETAQTLVNLGSLLQAQGEYRAARPLLERALAIREEQLGPEHPDTAVSLAILGSLLLDMGDGAGARAVSERALAIHEKALGPEHPNTATSLANLARVHQKLGAYAAARPLYERALAIREEQLGPENGTTADALHDLASLLQAQGDHAKARPLYERALAIRERVLGPAHPSTGRTLAELSRSYRALGQPAPAMDAALRAEAIGVAHVTRTARALSESAALDYAATRARGLDLALTLLAQDGDEMAQFRGHVFDAVVASRGVVLDEVGARHQRATATVRWARELGQSSEALARLLVRGATGAEVTAAQGRKERAERQLARATRATDDVTPAAWSALARSLPQEGALVSFVRYDRLGASDDRADEVEASYLAFVLRKGGLEPAVLALGEAGPIDKLVEAWKREAGGGALDGSAEKRYREVGAALRRAVWDPLSGALEGVRQLFVVPDGALHLVSLAALPAGESSYVIESSPSIHYLSVERDLVPAPRASAEPDNGLLAVGGPDFDAPSLFAALSGPRAAPGPGDPGDGQAFATAGLSGRRSAPPSLRDLRFEPLPGAVREAREVVRLWHEREHPDSVVAPPAGAMRATAESALLLAGAEASETAFKQRAPGHRVLHLATHGFFLQGGGVAVPRAQRGIGGLAGPARESPRSGPPPVARFENPLLLSGLVFAGANHRAQAAADEDDGVLTAEEIAALDLGGTQWAVLSACDTGAGDVRAGEGVFGLRRAFRVAGVGTLILSLWSVDDDTTRDWMSALYEARLGRRLGTIDAVREAGLSVLRARRAAGASTHPFFWGAFVAAGDWR